MLNSVRGIGYPGAVAEGGKPFSERTGLVFLACWRSGLMYFRVSRMRKRSAESIGTLTKERRLMILRMRKKTQNTMGYCCLVRFDLC